MGRRMWRRPAGSQEAGWYFSAPIRFISGMIRQAPAGRMRFCLRKRLYGKQKLEAEKRCLEILPDGVILRMSWMFDYKKKRPEEHDTLVTSVRQALKEGNRCSILYMISEASRILGEMIRHLEKALLLPGGVYNFGSPNECSTYEVVKGASEAAGNGYGSACAQQGSLCG